MSVITDPIFRTTYQGDTITRNGVTYVWTFGRYEVSSQIIVGTGDGFKVSKKVFLKFYGIVEPSVNLAGADLQVFIDGQEWTGEYRVENQNSVQIRLDEPFINTQRLITFKTTKGNPKFRYAIKSKVYGDNDVVIAKFGIAENIPIIGATGNSTVTYPASNTGTSNTGVNTNIGASVNYELTTVDIGVEGFNLNNQVVDATIGEVVGPVIL